MKIACIKPLSRNGEESLINELKQAALLFDKIGIPLLDVFLDFSQNAYLKVELILLKQNDFLFDAWQRSPVKLAEGTNLKEIQAELDFMTNLRKNQADSDLVFEAGARQSAVILNNQFDKPDFFSVPLLKILKLSNNNAIKKNDVIQITIEKIPIPKDDTSWEKIWEFKKNKEIIGKMNGLRTWINNAVKTSQEISEIKDELEFKLYEYRKSLEIHHIEYNSGILKSVIIGGAELIENIARLKFSSIAKGFFSAKEEKIELLKTELNAPGNELAYIYQTQETFK